VVGSVILPGLAVLALILVPFIDRSRMVKVTQRTVALAFVLLAAIGWGGLTAAAVKSTPKEALAAAVDYSGPTDWMQLSPEEMAGIAYFREENCVSCHAIGDQGTAVGPDLTKASIHKDAAWMIQHFKRPSVIRPGTSMPAIQLTDAQLNSLAAFLLKLNDKNAAALDNAPDFAVQGALVYQSNHCASCHLVNGGGMRVGPPLNGISKRQSRSWVEDHFANPQKMVPGSIMPAYKLPPKDLENLTSYLFALPE
jgi:ubiquinol-cytochrome c reductase cytochrome b subunit